MFALPAAGVVDAATMSLTQHPVSVVYDESNERVASRVLSICREEIDRIAREIGLEVLEPIVIEVVDDMAPYRSSLSLRLPDWGVAFAVLAQQVIVVDVPRATRSWNSLGKVIPHELSHLLVAQKTSSADLPIWFAEGMARWQAGEWSMLDSWQLMNAVWTKKIPRLEFLVHSYPDSEAMAQAAYRMSHAAFTDLFSGRYDELPEFLAAVASVGFEKAFDDYRVESLAVYMASFHTQLNRKYRSRLLVFQTGPLFSILAVLFVVAGTIFHIKRRRKYRDLDGPGADAAGGHG
jgi:hypothetical protein